MYHLLFREERCPLKVCTPQWRWTLLVWTPNRCICHILDEINYDIYEFDHCMVVMRCMVIVRNVRRDIRRIYSVKRTNSRDNTRLAVWGVLHVVLPLQLGIITHSNGLQTEDQLWVPAVLTDAAAVTAASLRPAVWGLTSMLVLLLQKALEWSPSGGRRLHSTSPVPDDAVRDAEPVTWSRV